jgi:hypothetical protein
MAAMVAVYTLENMKDFGWQCEGNSYHIYQGP